MMRGVLFGSSDGAWEERARGVHSGWVHSGVSDVLRGLHQNKSRSRYAGRRRLAASSFRDPTPRALSGDVAQALRRGLNRITACG